MFSYPHPIHFILECIIYSVCVHVCMRVSAFMLIYASIKRHSIYNCNTFIFNLSNLIGARSIMTSIYTYLRCFFSPFCYTISKWGGGGLERYHMHIYCTFQLVLFVRVHIDGKCFIILHITKMIESPVRVPPCPVN